MGNWKLERFSAIASACIAVFAWLYPPAHAEILVNEFVAANDTGLTDEDGDSSDWIELYNNGGGPVSLFGWGLSDDPTDPYQWTFPSVTLDGGEFLVIFASGKDRKPTDGAALHTNFSIERSGEYLALINGDGQYGSGNYFSPDYPKQLTDYSYGRDAGAGGAFRFFATPTPGAANSGSAYTGVTPDPEFEMQRGFYDTAINVPIVCEDSLAQIYYTTDGSVPSPQNGTLYAAPLAVSETMIFRARAFHNGYVPSEITTRSFLIGESAAVRSLPVMSIVGDAQESLYEPNGVMAIVGGEYIGGIWESTGPNDYNNPMQRGREYERPVSLEYIDPEGNQGFQIDCGIRVGGSNYHRPRYFREDGDWLGVGNLYAKFTFKLYFRETYGDSVLKYPLFPHAPTDEFDVIGLRGGHNDYINPFLSDELLRRVQFDMGTEVVTGSMVNLFINGDYKGYYNPCDRQEEGTFQRWYRTENEFDIITQSSGWSGEPRSGNRESWDGMFDWLNTHTLTDPASYAEFEQMLDIDQFIDYVLCQVYGQNFDWPDNNWAAARERRDGAKWKFYLWDVEGCFRNGGFDPEWTNFNKFPSWQANNGPGLNGGTDPNCILYRRLKQSPEFRTRFADRVQKHFFNNGAMEDENILARWTELADELAGVIPNISRFIPLGFMPDRRGIVLNACIDEGLWSFEAPRFLVDGGYQHGGPIEDGAMLSLSNPHGPGAMYYTLDGTDPIRVVPPYTKTLIEESVTRYVLVPTSADDAFPMVSSEVHVNFDHSGYETGTSGNPFNTMTEALLAARSGATIHLAGGAPALESNFTGTLDIPMLLEATGASVRLGGTEGIIERPAATWLSGTGGVGFETNSGYESYIGIDVRAQMDEENTSCYIRIPFTVTPEDLADFDSLTLRLRYDDGFAAFLNGERVLARNAPGTLDYDSEAIGGHNDSEALQFANFSLTEYLDLLVEGENLLAIHGLNDNIGSSDFLIDAEVIGGDGSASVALTSSAILYTGPIALTESTQVQVRTLADGYASGMNSAVFSQTAAEGTLRITELMYNPPANGAEYLELQNIGGAPIDLTGAYFSDGIEFTFPQTLLQLNAFIVLVSAEDESAFASLYPGVQIFGTYLGRLDNGGETVTIVESDGVTILDSVTYSDDAPWPTTADGQGYSLVLLDPEGDQDNAATWRPSGTAGGTPGMADSPAAIAAVLVNEALTHTDPPQIDTIEFYNPTGASADIRGWYITDNRTLPKKARIPDQAQYNIPAGGYATIDENSFGFNPGAGLPGFFLSSYGNEGVYLYSADAGGNLTGYSHGFEFTAAANGVSFGRHVTSDAREHFIAQQTNSLGAANSAPKVGPLVISEIHYNPPGAGGVEYLELTNISGADVRLWDSAPGGDPANTFKLDGIGYSFPQSQTVPANTSILVVNSAPPGEWGTAYGPFGDGAGLSNGGEAISLQSPDKPDLQFVPYIDMDRVEYSDSVPWPNADGNGLALRRINNNTFGGDPANWQAVTPTYTAGSGSPLVYVDFAYLGTLEYGTAANPFKTFAAAVGAVSAGGTVRIKGDSTVLNDGYIGTISSAMTLRATPAGNVRIGALSAKHLATMLTDASSSTVPPADTGVLRDALSQLFTRYAQVILDTEDGGTLDPIFGRTVFEPLMPYTRNVQGQRIADAKSPIAIRLRVPGDIDTDSLWASDVGTVGWKPVTQGDLSDVWVIFHPNTVWAHDDILDLEVGAVSTHGAPLLASGAFAITADGTAAPKRLHQPAAGADYAPLEIDAQDQAVLHHPHTAPPAITAALDSPLAIGPETVYDTPQRIWLPLPAGVAPESVRLFYYFHGSTDGHPEGWYPAERIAGWMQPDTMKYLQVEGHSYLGVLVNHAGIVQLGIAEEQPQAPLSAR